jgi:L-cysteine:1D-myo-inositol 2-amino-2-deoxy-alpha-D-glucopyranoside ligase
MQSWSSPAVPRLPGTGLVPMVSDSSSGGRVRSAQAGPGGIARIYVCGITPYDATHIGHAATYLTFDLLQRAWRDAGLTTRYVQNVTDVDDPLLERATATGVDWTDLAYREIELFRTDMAALRVLPPDAYVGVVEAIDLVIDLIGRLQQADVVYKVDDDYYCAIADGTQDNATPFGSVSRLPEATMLAYFTERGGDPDRPGKRNKFDCLLWLAQRPGEPGWDSPLGVGRPGWHVECTAIALANLGTDFDVQGGGTDLVFPHHEMSAVQASIVTGKPFAHAYVHQAMVRLDGEKMSKSLGNLVFVSKLREAGIDPAAIRLAVLAHHYRTEWDWTEAGLQEALDRLAAWRAAADVRLPVDGVLRVVREALADDLDAPRALRLIDGVTVGAFDTDAASDDAGSATLRDVVDALLGVAL